MAKIPTDMPFQTRLRHRVVNAVLRSVLGLGLVLPYRWRVPIVGWVVSRIVSPLAGYRKRVRENLILTHPDMSEAELLRMERAVPDNAGRTLIEIYSGDFFIQRAKNAPISGPGQEALQAAHAAGRPIILVTAHLGNYDVARAALIDKGYNMGALYRRLKNPYFNDHYVRAISKIGTPMFEQGRRGMMQLVKHLKSGGVLGILTDLHSGDGEPIPFFDVPAMTSLVTAELALKYDAALIPVYGIRRENGLDFDVILDTPIEHSDPMTMTAQISKQLETVVRDHMDQWFWIHRRWK